MNESNGSFSSASANGKWRSILFRVGVVAAALSAAAGVCSWVNPFPLLSTAEGGWRVNPLDGWVLIIGLSTALATMVLGLFGKRVARVSVVVLGVLLFLFNYVGWLGNHR